MGGKGAMICAGSWDWDGCIVTGKWWYHLTTGITLLFLPLVLTLTGSVRGNTNERQHTFSCFLLQYPVMNRDRSDA